MNCGRSYPTCTTAFNKSTVRELRNGAVNSTVCSSYSGQGVQGELDREFRRDSQGRDGRMRHASSVSAGYLYSTRYQVRYQVVSLPLNVAFGMAGDIAQS